MSLFAKPKCVLWVKGKSLDVYFDREDNNVFNLDINLLSLHSVEELAPLAAFIKQHNLKECTVLIGDDIVITKSFIYDSVINSIDKKEVIGLAESFIPFKIDPDHLEYELSPGTEKTIILTTIYDKSKLDAIKTNLNTVAIKALAFKSVSQAVSHIISGFFKEQYFLIYPLAKNEYTLFLADKNKVYLTVNIKGPSLDIQKIINYAGLYFSHPINKIFVPGNIDLELNATVELDKTPYNEAQIAKEAKKAGNIPIPVVGIFSDIIFIPMENKKNYLPIITVFIVTAAIASMVIWYIMNRNKTDINAPVVETETTQEQIPTSTPIPTVVEISKTLKIQVLNATKINGQAATLKEMLTKLGFTSVAVGNGKDEVTGNEIRLSTKNASASSYFKTKMTDFPAEFKELPASSTFDAVFVIGTDLKTGAAPAAEESTATATPSKKPTATTSATPTIEP